MAEVNEKTATATTSAVETQDDTTHRTNTTPVTSPVVQEWPNEPQPLAVKSALVEALLKAYDAFLCLLPLANIVKAAICAILNHHEPSRTGAAMEKINGQVRCLFLQVLMLRY